MEPMALIERTDEKSTIIIDASALKSASCRLRLFNNVVLGYREKTLNNDTHWGSAFHLFRSVYKITGDEDLAMFQAEKLFNKSGITVKEKKKYLDTAFLTAACIDYLEKYGRKEPRPIIDPFDDKPLVEPKTRLAIPLISEPDMDIIVAGTMDAVEPVNENIFNGGSTIDIVDCKTSMAFNSYTFFDSYILNPQLLLYRWAIREYAKLMPGSIWDTLNSTPNLGARIDGVFYRGSKEGEQPEIKFHRSKPIVFKPWQIDQMDRGLKSIAQELVIMVRRWKNTGELPDRDGVIVNLCEGDKWGVCKYCRMCAAVDDDSREAVADELFIRKYYNPLNF